MVAMVRKISLAFFMVLFILGIPLTVLSYHLNSEGLVNLLARITPQPTRPDESIITFNPSIIVWFKTGTRENETKHLIESFDLSRYKLSDPEIWENAEHCGVAVIEVPSGSEDEYIQKFKSNGMVLDAQLNVVYEL